MQCDAEVKGERERAITATFSVRIISLELPFALPVSILRSRLDESDVAVPSRESRRIDDMCSKQWRGENVSKTLTVDTRDFQWVI